MHDLSLRPVTRDNFQETLRLKVQPAQQPFLAGHEPVAAIVLSKAYVGFAGAAWTPYALYAGDEMVGLLALARWPDAPEQQWIFHFFVDSRYQGRGYGKAALESLVALLERSHPACEALMLVVHPENDRARQLYERTGFRLTGAMRWGEPVYELSLRGRS